MKSIGTKLIALFAVTVFTVSAFASPVPPDQPFMQAALANLKDAQNSLRKATADKGGHRESALNLTASAITAVNDGIDYDRTHYTPGRRKKTGDDSHILDFPTPPDQPNMVRAREHMQAALINLRKASADKGGYRERAISLTNDAINQVNAGIEYDRTH